MEIDIVEVGLLRANCYILSNDKCEAIIIDPGSDVNKIIKNLKDKVILGIFYTHSHPDHVGALEDLEIKYNLKGNDFSKNPFEMEVINTPGHYFDSKTFYFKDEKVMFTGDFLFKNSIGRTDLYGASNTGMKNSLNLIKNYPDDVVIYPGHGASSMLGEEKQYFEDYIKRYL